MSLVSRDGVLLAIDYLNSRMGRIPENIRGDMFITCYGDDIKNEAKSFILSIKEKLMKHKNPYVIRENINNWLEGEYLRYDPNIASRDEFLAPRSNGSSLINIAYFI
jgi:hypothetical protein